MAGLREAVAAQAQPRATASPTLTVDASPDGGEFTGLVTTIPVRLGDYEGAFAKVYELAGLNPDDYRIVDDTVRFSCWEQSSRAADGSRDRVTLYSYRARFRRVTELDQRAEELVQRLADDLRRRRITRRIPGAGLGTPCTYTVMLSDWQLGKNEIREADLDHGTTGVEQTVWRVTRAVEKSADRVKALRRSGRNITGVAVAFMGDPNEGVADSYENQTFNIELNLTDQIMRAIDLASYALEELLPLGDEQDVLAALCNHGQLARRGTKTNITDDSDNTQNLILRLLRDRIIGPKFKDARWHIPGDQMITTLDIAGVPVAAAHGHKIRGTESAWLLKQTATLQATRGRAPRVWLTAHRHSQDTLDLGAIHRIQAATADGGSKHFLDETAIYSTPGTTTLLIGNHDERGFSDVELL